jgi:hypothetical protein
MSILWMFCFSPVIAQPQVTPSLCGDPPPVKDEKIAGELQGKAQFLSKFLGDAALTGKVESVRTEIFSKYPNADKTWMSAYTQFQVCILLMSDTKMSTSDKISELMRVRNSFHD